jgi:serine/threonine protein phosphatase PrpC
MGSTIVGLAIEGNYFSVANVGDSRIYLIRGAAIELLTEDHSVVMEQVRRGLMTRDEAEHSPMQNVIVRALGSEESVEPDLADHELLAGDLLLLCSDGVTRHLTDGAIFSIATASDNLAKICDDLIQAAKDAGSDDNITCLVVRAAEPSWRDRVFGKGRQSQSSI